jgi:virulence-associated protein VapD
MQKLKRGGNTMAGTTARNARSPSIRPGLPASFKKKGVVYALALDLDSEQLRLYYGDPYNNAYVGIRKILEGHQFQWQQGSVYFGSPAVTAASLMVAVIDLTNGCRGSPRRYGTFACCGSRNSTT